MFLKYFRKLRCLLLTVYCLLTPGANAQVDYTQFVDPFIGTGGHGHTYPGATVPFGMVQLSPDTRVDGSWDGCSGYHYSDTRIYGFSHTHLSGTGVSDYGDILLMPVNMGSWRKPDTWKDPALYSDAYNHKMEWATPGFYSVRLAGDILVQLTTTQRVGLHRYSFPVNGKAGVVLDLLHRDKLLEGALRQVNDSTFEGIRRSEGWARDQRVYYRIEFSMPVKSLKIQNDSAHVARALFEFDIKDRQQPLLVKVALSGVSEEGAMKNMQAELPHWDFEKVKLQAHDAWQKELSKIEVAGPEEKMKIFYTALYHCFLQPNIYNDVDGRYRGRDMQIHTAEGFDYYTVFSLWDTFRAWHPLMTVIDRKRTLDFIKTFLAQYEQGGLLPVWELSSNETECMIGYHAVSVIADAAMKGITDFDMEKAFAAMKKSAESRDRYGLDAYIDKGCLSVEDESESVSKTLEYAYDDWCIAQMAKLLGKEDDYATYMLRSQSWKNLFDPYRSFIRPRKNGGWMQPFDPYEVNNQYTEANAWQYTFFVPHDIDGYVEMMGGTELFEQKLDSLFSVSSKTSGREQPDITGMIGQYAHGNEPSHHLAYLYTCVGEPWKAYERVQQIMNRFYHASPDGLAGNEDCGQMSAWYVLSALGLYPVCPGKPVFMANTPSFPHARIRLESGKVVSIPADGLSALQGNVPFVKYEDLVAGGTLAYQSTYFPVSPKKKKTGEEEVSHSIVRAPVFAVNATVFRDSMPLMFFPSRENIQYTLDGSTPNERSTGYRTIVPLYTSTTVKAIAFTKDGRRSKVVTAHFHKLPHPDWMVRLNATYNKQYTAGGDVGIIDGLRGDPDWRKGGWQGYQSQDFECLIDMKELKTVSRISAGFLQDTRSWILMPKRVEFSFSTDSIHFSKPVIAENTVKDSEMNVVVSELSREIKPQQARYVKVKAVNYGKLPKWHPGYASEGDAFIFIDEIIIE